MKKTKGNSLIAVIIVVLIISIIAVIGFIIYKSAIEEDKQVNANNEFGEELTNNSTEEINEIIEENNTQNEVIVPIIDPNQNVENEELPLISNTFYYNQLNSYGKKIYDKLKKDKSKLITGNYVFDFQSEFSVLLHEENGEKLLGEAFQSAWNAFSYDNTDLFYIDINKMTLTTESRTIAGITTYYNTIGPGENANYLRDNFQEEYKIVEAQEYIDNIIRQIKEQTASDSDVEKARKVQNWLISIIDYDDSESAVNKHNIYGALRERRAVCEGYARTFKYIMEKISVPCILVSGTGTNSEGQIESHAWNYIQIQIDFKWYAVDVTWNDPIILGNGNLTNEMKYKYFLNGSDKFFENHTEDGIISENSMKFTYPTISTSNYPGY